ncbi:MAG: glutamate 5-kinase, partial [Candidatus Ratteibacteria bacterium]
DPKNCNRSKLISEVCRITDFHLSIAKNASTSELGRGGMVSKLLAIRRVLKVGCMGFIANGKRPWVLRDIFLGKKIGTIFLPEKKNGLEK